MVSYPDRSSHPTTALSVWGSSVRIAPLRFSAVEAPAVTVTTHVAGCSHIVQRRLLRLVKSSQYANLEFKILYKFGGINFSSLSASWLP